MRRRAIGREFWRLLFILPIVLLACLTEETHADDKALVDLGTRLFFDPRLSGDGSISCSTCHVPEQGFSRTFNERGDRQVLSPGYPGTSLFRNAPTLLNTALKSQQSAPLWGWSGSLGTSLEVVLMHEMTNPTVMNMDLHLLRERLRQDPNYRQLCQAAGAEDCTPELAEAALVAFIETLRPALTPFDTGVISDAAERGQKLFEGKARCSSCHAGPQMSDGRPHNTGVPENLDIFRDPVRHLTYIAVLEGLGVPGATQWRRDVGYYVISRRVSDIGKFITPPLRELKYTAPYMHNGTLKSLAAVVEYYDQGGGRDDPLPNELTPLNLSPQEKRDIVAFLESLSSATPMAIADIDIPQSYPALRVESAED